MTHLDKVLYTAKTHSTGGRDGGASRTSDGHLSAKPPRPWSTRHTRFVRTQERHAATLRLRSSWSEQELSRSDDVSNVKTSGGTLRSRSYEGPSGRLRDLEVHALGRVLPLSRHPKLRS